MIRLAYFDSNDFTQLMDWIKDEEAGQALYSAIRLHSQALNGILKM